MPAIARLQHANHGNHFRAIGLRGIDPQLIDPFLGVDHAWMSAPTFPPHPHAGFSAVSYLFLDSETGIANRDSIGNRNLIQPGGLHWTTAARGVVHEEVPAEPGKTVHSLQIFVNLARERQSDAPFALSLAPEDVPVVQLPGVKMRVALGSFGKAHSPLTPPTPIQLLDISIEAGAELAVPIAPGHSAFVMPIVGTAVVDGQSFDSGDLRLPLFLADSNAKSITLRSLQGAAKAVFFSGFPLRQSVNWRGSIAMSSAEASTAALAAYRREEFGSL